MQKWGGRGARGRGQRKGGRDVVGEGGQGPKRAGGRDKGGPGGRVGNEPQKRVVPNFGVWPRQIKALRNPCKAPQKAVFKSL